MALRIICADADFNVAGSLASFLRSQNITAGIERLRNSKPTKICSGRVVLWSRNMALIERKNRLVSDEFVVVRLDKTPLPDTFAKQTIVDAESVGHRVGRAWRDVVRNVKQGAGSSPLTIGGLELYEGVPTEASKCVNSADILDGAQGLSALPKQKAFVLPVVVLLTLLIGLIAGVALLHPKSPYSVATVEVTE